jgi:uncharacterized membrane protein YfcA
MLYVLLALAGVVIGLLGSLLGVGGGIFMVPLLLLGGLVGTAQEATGTSIVGVMATGISGSIGYFLRRQNPWQISLALVPGALGGSYLGAFLTGKISSGALALAFGLFLLYPAIVLLLGKEPKELVKAHEQRNFSLLLALLVGVLAGTANSLFGIGGGVIMVPALLWLGYPMIQAVAASLLVMIPTGALLHGLTCSSWPNPLGSGYSFGSRHPSRWPDRTSCGCSPSPTYPAAPFFLGAFLLRS